MNQVQEFLNAIEKHNKIIILRHILPDGDAYGFQFGLRNIIKLNWPEKIVKISGQPNLRLNFIGEDFDDIADDEFSESLVIVGDTANVERIDDQRWKQGKMIIKIDHHPNHTPYGDLMLVDSNYCAASEILAEIVKEQNLKINQQTAKIIFHGIVTDSNRFLLRFPKPRTFSLASFLLETGFDLQDLYQTMYACNEDELKFVSYVYQNYQVSKHGVAYLFLDQETLKKLKIDTDYAAYDNVVLLANIKNRPIWAFFCQYPDGKIRVELRSQNLTINHIAQKYGGGGHKTASGIRIDNFEIAKQVISDLDSVAKENYHEKDV
ncbi:MAG: DHH family phosphoesterase [Spiroplasma sp.]